VDLQAGHAAQEGECAALARLRLRGADALEEAHKHARHEAGLLGQRAVGLARQVAQHRVRLAGAALPVREHARVVACGAARRALAGSELRSMPVRRGAMSQGTARRCQGGPGMEGRPAARPRRACQAVVHDRAADGAEEGVLARALAGHVVKGERLRRGLLLGAAAGQHRKRLAAALLQRAALAGLRVRKGPYPDDHLDAVVRRAGRRGAPGAAGAAGRGAAVMTAPRGEEHRLRSQRSLERAM